MFAKNNNTPLLRVKLETIGETHSKARFNVPPSLYIHWVDSLLATVKQHDKGFSTNIESDWRSVLGPTIEFLTARYEDDPGRPNSTPPHTTAVQGKLTVYFDPLDNASR